jgi:hypothetical protein
LPTSIQIIPRWRGIVVDTLVEDEMKIDRAGFSITESILIERSFMRYKKAGIKIKLIIDWFENQVVDRALYLGVKKYFPEVYTKGYQGFIVGKGFVGIDPVSYEYSGGVLPDELLVTGKMYIEDKITSCPELLVSTAPAFRMQKTLRFKQQCGVKRNIVLLAMPIYLNEARSIINLATSTKLPNGIKFMIKPHPTMNVKKFKSFFPDTIEVTNNDLHDVFQNTCLLVTAASTSALDAILCNIPVAILGERSTYTNNPLDGIISNDHWSVCYNYQDLINAINRKKHSADINISNYIVHASKENIYKMLNSDYTP